jgi:MFS family permease
VAVILLLIREAKPDEKHIFKGVFLKDFSSNFRLYLVSNALFALGAFSYSFLLIFAKDAGFKPGFVPVLYLLYTAAASFLSLPFGRLSDRFGRKSILLLSFGLWSVVSLGMVFGQSLVFMGGMFVVYGLHKAALEPAQRALVSDLAPAGLRASFLGTFQMVIGLCALPASFLAGLLWDRFGRAVPFLLSLALTVGAAVLLLFVKETAKNKKQEKA